MPVQIDADFTKIVFFGKADGRLLFCQRNFTQANFRRSRRRWWRSDWSWLIRDVDAIVLSERFQAAIEALGDKTKFPVTIPAIDFTEDQRGFLTTAQFYLTTDQRGIATFNLYGQMIQGGNCMAAVTGNGERDFLHVGLEAGQINGENAIGPFSTEANGTIFITGLPVKDHIAVTPNFPVSE